ncbi:MAG: Eco29kI family restriction endonuclease, partial [Actinomycetota bacterium]|nr:Eco29kI family restriction endonuclease [Actinomycetota bacterium]
MEVFKAPSNLARELVDFFGGRPCRPLAELPRERTTISRYIGVYALYPAPGAHPLYESVGEANREGCRLPIYVGKAVPKGARTGQAEREGRTTASNNLYLRLREHRGSI